MAAFCIDNNVHVIVFFNDQFVSVKVLIVAIVGLRKTFLTSKEHVQLNGNNV